MEKKKLRHLYKDTPANLEPIIHIANQQNLKKIIQITEQSETVKSNIETRHCQQFEDQQSQRKTPLSKFVSCIKLLIKRWFKKDDGCQNIHVNESQVSYMIERLRKKQLLSEVIVVPKSEQLRNKRTLVLDLDQTLVYTQFKKPYRYDFQIKIENKGKIVDAYVIKRFGLDSFLFQMSNLYEIILFSASKRKYIDRILAEIDPKKRITEVVSQQHCLIINDHYYLKPLKILGRKMSEIVLVDDHRMAGTLHPENFYKIESFKGNIRDRKLVKLGFFLNYLAKQQSIVPISINRKNFENMEIRLQEKRKKEENESLKEITEQGGDETVKEFQKSTSV